MHAAWLEDLESLQEIAENDSARRLFLRMALLSREGRLEPFLSELAADDELDPGTKGAGVELATDAPFLAAFEEYLLSTQRVH
jgi:hypothetical protein